MRKVCTKCNIEKDIEKFSRRGDRKCGRLSRCKVCMESSNKIWREKNKEYLREYYVANKERFAVTGKKNKDENRQHVNERERIRKAKNPEKYREACNQWRLNNLDKDAKRSRDRQALKLSAKPVWANDKYISLFFKLAKIEEKRTSRKVHVDHIVPLKGKLVCGLHCEDNLQLMFAEANISKGNRHVS